MGFETICWNMNHHTFHLNIWLTYLHIWYDIAHYGPKAHTKWFFLDPPQKTSHQWRSYKVVFLGSTLWSSNPLIFPSYSRCGTLSAHTRHNIHFWLFTELKYYIWIKMRENFPSYSLDIFFGCYWMLHSNAQTLWLGHQGHQAIVVSLFEL